MIRMIYAEDDPTEREGLMSVMEWEKIGIEVIGVAEDGKEAYEMLERLLPDMLLTDVKMPLMGGVELARKARELLPDMKIVFITGYDEFEFALAAIKHEVCDYLLKPVEVEEAQQALARIAKVQLALKARRREQAILQTQMAESMPILERHFLWGLVQNEYTDPKRIAAKLDFFGIAFRQAHYFVITAYSEETDNPDENEGKRQLRMAKLGSMITEELQRLGTVRVFPYLKNELVVIINLDCPSRAELLRMLRHMQKSVNLEQRVQLALGVSNLVEHCTGLAQGYLEASRACRQRFYLGNNEIVCYSDISGEESKQDASLALVTTELVELLRIGDYEQMLVQMDALFDEMKSGKGISRTAVQNFCIMVLSQAIAVLTSKSCNMEEIFSSEYSPVKHLLALDTIGDIRKFMKDVLRSFAEQLESCTVDRTIKITQQIKQLIRARYREDLTLELIATETFFSPNYLNSLFKKSEGISIIKYLIAFRIEQATQLLAKPDAVIYRVSEAVGYQNVAYFSNLFKKQIGVTPLDYRDGKRK